jgi:uncharacterized protein
MDLHNNSRNKLITRPEPVARIIDYCPTGNEYVALPETDCYGGIKTVNLLRIDHFGLLEFSGSSDTALLSPFLSVDDNQITPCSSLRWHYDLGWLPAFCLDSGNGFSLNGLIFAPPGFKGFLYQLSVRNRTGKTLKVELGWEGCWDSFNYSVFSRRKINLNQEINFNIWTNCLVLEASAGLPFAALALATMPDSDWHINSDSCHFRTKITVDLDPGEEKILTLYGAVNLEADGAATTNFDLRRRGARTLLDHTREWLGNRYLTVDSPDLETLLNKNLFFSYFYSVARSLDSDQLVALTSRSPRYYVSAAFWSRDALLWSFPAIMLADQNYSRELLLTVFKRHIAHAGEHAHYLNGTILYPGFELDQLAAYLIALGHYLLKTDDYSLVKEEAIQEGLTLIAAKTLQKFDPVCGLFSTFLDPSDDPVDYPFLTYDNVLLKKSFSLLANLQYRGLWFNENDFAILARELENAIYEHCTVNGPCGLMFTWAVDGKGKFSLYDNPPGSLQLLAHYGFCSLKDTIFINTVRWIRSPNNSYFHQGSPFEEAGSLHSSNPWPLGACNDLLACNTGALDFLKRTKMDNGFFCETVNPVTGEVSTGAAFASAAGFLAYALYTYLKKK